jgi:hypothetical protein
VTARTKALPDERNGPEAGRPESVKQDKRLGGRRSGGILRPGSDRRRDLLRRVSAPVARTTGRYVQTLANHASMYAIVTLALFGIDYFPREHFNADGFPKVAHKTREAAIQHKRSLILAGRASKHLQVYECSYCGSWHVGHRGGRR